MKMEITRGYFETAVDLRPREFRLRGECVNAKLPFHYEGTDYYLHLPDFDFSHIVEEHQRPRPTYVGSEVLMDWPRNLRGWANFGSDYLRTSAEVEAFLCDHLVVRTRHEVDETQAAKISESLLIWQQLFVEWYEALNLVNLAARNSGQVQEARSAAGHLTKGNAYARVRTNDTPTIRVVVSMSNDDAAGVHELRAALSKASSGTPPPLTYLYLLQSLRHLDAKQYRQSVLDAATALELALTEIAHQKLGGPGTINATKFFKDHRMLGNLYSGVSNNLQVRLPPKTTMLAAVGKPRNDAVHEGKPVSNIESTTAFNLWSKYSPRTCRFEDTASNLAIMGTAFGGHPQQLILMLAPRQVRLKNLDHSKCTWVIYPRSEADQYLRFAT